MQQRLQERARPLGSVVMLQRWERLLFLHWQWDAHEIQRTLPPRLSVDTFEGIAWVGLVPLFMRDVRPRFVPPIPPLSDFLELNARTYVYDEKGRPGVYFYSLDCNQPLAVEAARRLLLLNYEHATMSAEVEPTGWVNFKAQRSNRSETAEFKYRPFGVTPQAAPPESLEFFLLERYRLFAADGAGEQLNSIRVCHAPYLWRQAEVTAWSDAMLELAGLDPKGRAPDHICATEPVEVETFAPERV